MTSGRSWTVGVAGAYWMSCISSFSYTTAPGVVARLRPTSKTFSSVVETRPLCASSIRFSTPFVKLSPRVSRASLIASGLVATKLAGLSASIIWRAAKRIRSFASGSASIASTQSRRNAALIS